MQNHDQKKQNDLEERHLALKKELGPLEDEPPTPDEEIQNISLNVPPQAIQRAQKTTESLLPALGRKTNTSKFRRNHMANGVRRAIFLDDRLWEALQTVAFKNRCSTSFLISGILGDWYMRNATKPLKSNNKKIKGKVDIDAIEDEEISVEDLI